MAYIYTLYDHSIPSQCTDLQPPRLYIYVPLAIQTWLCNSTIKLDPLPRREYKINKTEAKQLKKDKKKNERSSSSSDGVELGRVRSLRLARNMCVSVGRSPYIHISICSLSVCVYIHTYASCKLSPHILSFSHRRMKAQESSLVGCQAAV